MKNFQKKMLQSLVANGELSFFNKRRNFLLYATGVMHVVFVPSVVVVFFIWPDVLSRGGIVAILYVVLSLIHTVHMSNIWTDIEDELALKAQTDRAEGSEENVTKYLIVLAVCTFLLPVVGFFICAFIRLQHGLR